MLSLIKNKHIAIALGCVFVYLLYFQVRGLYFVLTDKNILRYASISYYFYEWWGHFLFALGLAGFIQFILTKYRFSKLLRIYLFYCCFCTIPNLINSIVLQLTMLAEKLFANYVWYYSEAIIIGVIFFAALYIIQKGRKPQFELLRTDNDFQIFFSPVKWYVRLANRSIDLLYLIIVAYTIFNLFQDMTGRLFRNAGSILISEILFLLLYYVLMESVFGVTLGKIITNTRVVNEEGAKAGFVKILGRTICRFIPFDALSFLFTQRGWHDSLSGTYVIKEKYAWEDDASIVDEIGKEVE